jgi:FAD/FMN-containing dehydrogenase
MWNFNRLVNLIPKKQYSPKTLPELQTVIKNNTKIRMLGSIHTFNKLSVSDGITVRTDKLNKILEVRPDRKLVRAESGVLLKDLLAALEKYNLTLSVLPSISNISIAGGISTGSHGSNSHDGSLSNQVEIVEAVLADGTLQTIDYNNKDVLKAFRCSLGCLGAIYAVTLKCENLFSIKEEIINTTWKTFYDIIDRTIDSADYIQLTIDQFSQDLKTTVNLRKKIPLNNKYPTNNQLLTSQRYSPYIETELAVPYENTNNALHAVVNYHNEFYKKHKLKSDSDLFMRFNRQDDTLISMAAGRKTTYISTFFSVPTSKAKIDVIYLFMNDLNNMMIRDFSARPHYGKINNLDRAQMERLYGASYYNFMDIRDHFDPHKKFTNDVIDKMLK